MIYDFSNHDIPKYPVFPAEKFEFFQVSKAPWSVQIHTLHDIQIGFFSPLFSELVNLMCDVLNVSYCKCVQLELLNLLNLLNFRIQPVQATAEPWEGLCFNLERQLLTTDQPAKFDHRNAFALCWRRGLINPPMFKDAIGCHAKTNNESEQNAQQTQHPPPAEDTDVRGHCAEVCRGWRSVAGAAVAFADAEDQSRAGMPQGSKLYAYIYDL